MATALAVAALSLAMAVCTAAAQTTTTATATTTSTTAHTSCSLQFMICPVPAHLATGNYVIWGKEDAAAPCNKHGNGTEFYFNITSECNMVTAKNSTTGVVVHSAVLVHKSVPGEVLFEPWPAIECRCTANFFANTTWNLGARLYSGVVDLSSVAGGNGTNKTNSTDEWGNPLGTVYTYGTDEYGNPIAINAVDLDGRSQFLPSIKLFPDDSFTQELKAGDVFPVTSSRFHVQVGSNWVGDIIGIVKCAVSPTGAADDPFMQVVLEDSCAKGRFDAQPFPSVAKNIARLSFRKFKFVGRSSVYITCLVRRCTSEPCGGCGASALDATTTTTRASLTLLGTTTTTTTPGLPPLVFVSTTVTTTLGLPPVFFVSTTSTTTTGLPPVFLGATSTTTTLGSPPMFFTPVGTTTTTTDPASAPDSGSAWIRRLESSDPGPELAAVTGVVFQVPYQPNLPLAPAEVPDYSPAKKVLFALPERDEPQQAGTARSSLMLLGFPVADSAVFGETVRQHLAEWLALPPAQVTILRVSIVDLTVDLQRRLANASSAEETSSALVAEAVIVDLEISGLTPTEAVVLEGKLKELARPAGQRLEAVLRASFGMPAMPADTAEDWPLLAVGLFTYKEADASSPSSEEWSLEGRLGERPVEAVAVAILFLLLGCALACGCWRVLRSFCGPEERKGLMGGSPS
mmetsp:Transcript_136145/g.435523  ORF Transcript_136145/g.435523 Transcript_136145/m.435523 type:complete len:686 (-) Transcript_136145:77-2134(-)